MTTASRPRVRRKFHNLKTPYKGVTYDSKGEAEFAWKLDQRVARGELVEWSRPKAIVLIDGAKARERITYTPDFWVVPVQGYSYYVDYKGSHATETAAWKLKVKLWKRSVPFELRVAYPDGSEKIVATGEVAA